MAERKIGVGVFERMYKEAIDDIDYDKIAEGLQEFARNGHRQLSGRHYENQTYTLRDNTYGRYSEEDKAIYVGTDSANIVDPQGREYDKFVLYGNQHWNGDDFLSETINHKNDVMTKLFQEGLDKSIEKQNRKQNIFGKMFGFMRGLFGR